MQHKPQGPLVHRLSIRILTIIFAILVYWIAGFLIEDIQSITGPDYATIENKYINSELINKVAELDIAIAENNRLVQRKREELELIASSSNNLQNTINQLIELQKLSIQKATAVDNSEKDNLSVTLSQFLENQKLYQTYNADLAKLIDQERKLETQKSKLEQQIEQQRKPAQLEFANLNAAHVLYLAYLQMLILIPLLIVGAILIIKQRSSIYFPFIIGYGVAIFLQIIQVIHEYFPTQYFKYILASILIIVVAKLLVYFIQAVAFPKADWLMKQYREAYASFLCPVCEYPIRIGPRKFLFWTRRTVNKVVLPNNNEQDKPYACPACGTMLFENCIKCQNIRHSLFSFCQTCGNEKT